MIKDLNLIKPKAIVIGGSAGSFRPVCNILSNLPKNFDLPVILCLHRLKTYNKGFAEALSGITGKNVIEPNDKDIIKSGEIYLAPSNYHLYISEDNTFSLSTEELINYSRPSIDITFSSASDVYKSNMVGIILSGANTDGVKGICKIKKRGGFTIAQNLESCEVTTMPKGAIKKDGIHQILKVDKISEFLDSL